MAQRPSGMVSVGRDIGGLLPSCYYEWAWDIAKRGRWLEVILGAPTIMQLTALAVCSQISDSYCVLGDVTDEQLRDCGLRSSEE